MIRGNKNLLGMVIPIGAIIGLTRLDGFGYPAMSPMLALIFMAGQKLGKTAGALIGLIATIVSSIYTGIGLWCIMQAILWIGAGVLGGCLKKKTTSTVLVGIYAFLFGVIMDIFCYYLVFTLGYPNVMAAVIGGLPHDLRYSVISASTLIACYIIEYIYQKIKQTALKSRTAVEKV